MSERLSGSYDGTRRDSHLRLVRTNRTPVAQDLDDSGADEEEEADPSDAHVLVERDDRVGKFRVVRRLGSGGTAVVYEAQDTELHRKVALKLLRSGRAKALGSAEREVMLREAQAMARLNHPNVIAVHEVGVYRDRVYLAMEFVEGQTLTKWQSRGRRSWREVLEAYLQAAQGLVAAHEAGLVHRDFKPDNVLVGNDGRVRVLDLGLARLDRDDEALSSADTLDLPSSNPDDDPDLLRWALSQTGALKGTPLYMAPEQHRASRVDARADQYAFCVSLWEALYGEPPFHAETYKDLREKVLHGRPSEPPRDTKVPGWLHRVLKRGLSVAPRDRFASMAELVAEVSRQRRSARQRIFQFLGVLTLVNITLLSLGLTRTYQQKNQEIEAKSAEVRERFAQAQTEEALSSMARGQVLEARALVRSALEKHDSNLGRSLWWRLSRDPLIWSLRVPSSASSIVRVDRGGELLVTAQDDGLALVDPRTKTLRRLRGMEGVVVGLDLRPDGRAVAVGTGGGDVGVWRLDATEPEVVGRHDGPVKGVRFSVDGTQIAAVGGGDGVVLWPIEKNAGHRRLPRIEGTSASRLMFAPDGARLGVTYADGSIREWDLDGGSEPTVVPTRNPLIHVAFLAYSPDGTTLAVPSPDGRAIDMWTRAGDEYRRVRSLVGHDDLVSEGRFAAGGTRFYSVGYDKTLREWDVVRGVELRVLGTSEQQMRSMGMDEAGRYIATASNGELKLWDAGSGVAQEQPQTAGHVGRVHAIDFAPDGRTIASAGADGTVRVWSVPTVERVRVLRGHTDQVFTVSYSPSGRFLASGSFDRTIRIWDARDGLLTRTLEGHEAGVSGVAFLSDTELVSSSWDRSVRVWDTVTGRALRAFALDQGLIAMTVDREQGDAYVSGLAGAVERVDLATGRTTTTERTRDGVVWGLAWVDAKKALAVASSAGEVTLRDRGRLGRVDFATATYLAVGERADVSGMSVDRTGRVAAVTRGTEPPALIDLASGARQGVASVGIADGVAVSPDGRIVAFGGTNGDVRLIDVPSRRGLQRGVGPVWPGLPGLTHRGWSQASGRGQTGSTAVQWQDAVASRAQVAATNGHWLCLVGAEGATEVWDLREDVRVVREESREPRESGRPPIVRVLADGCLVVSEGVAKFTSARGPGWTLDKVTGTGVDGERAMVARGRDVLYVEPSGQVSSPLAEVAGVIALTRVGDRIVGGFADGSLELLTGERAGSQLPTSTRAPVTVLLPCGPSLLCAGFGDGTFEVVEVESAEALLEAKLHGSVLQVAHDGGRVELMSELGDRMAIDLSIFIREPCEVLREVWGQVPFVWERGIVETRPPPDDHPCLAGDGGS